MKVKTETKKAKRNPCMVCGKTVRWGVSGCPVIKPGQEMLALMGGGFMGWQHYNCEKPSVKQN
jgi:hypothetical protein